jgi:hypothetical protein
MFYSEYFGENKEKWSVCKAFAPVSELARKETRLHSYTDANARLNCWNAY